MADSSFFKRGIPIIAVDGGANRLVSIDVQPDLVIGNLDSINPNLRAIANPRKVSLRHTAADRFR
ncbi:hypothetical protein [Wolbachia endosymbiont of Cantharis cryptica]|uniref:hypothetical protein n=1 Tax=Wolbachia endosymbiont of Cantharis cryptica TaxID=3066132 RepID=UPI00376EB3F9